MSDVTLTLTRAEHAALVDHLRETRPSGGPYPTLARADLKAAIDKLERASPVQTPEVGG